ncbi:hypothetical protein PAERUG_P40_Scotland_4_VIM_2_09_12_04102 [Pseudomonas aeruginosa]|nr:hypothetical protein PAERUG_P40_Scotland_4_VIM_2_09_12_04102 [Pseudomonas aeruginosa]
MSRNYPPGYCPDHCSAGQPSRQMAVHDELLNQFPDEARAEAQAHGGAKRCTYCGLVYLHPIKQFGGRLGYWNSGVRGEGWSK